MAKWVGALFIVAVIFFKPHHGNVVVLLRNALEGNISLIG